VSDDTQERKVAVVGAGPAGLYAARALAQAGVHVVLLNRDIKPGGLAEYGIYHTKLKMKEGLRKQFRQVLSEPRIAYRGNVVVGEGAAVSLDELRELGFQAILVTVGAQGTKWLGLPGEDLQGVYHAKDLVYHYNRLPPFAQMDFPIGQRVALVGVGNVMLDIAHWVIRDLMVKDVVAVARRGPAEVKFTKKEMEYIAANLDIAALDDELERVRPAMEAVGQSTAAAREYILSALPKALPPRSDTRFWFDFLASPKRILGDDRGRVCGLEVEDTTLVAWNGDTKAKGLGTTRTLPVDTVIFCIGDRVDEAFGLPVQWNAFVKNPNPDFPVDGLSYEAFDPEANQPIRDVFVAGWAREASSGLVGVARRDGENGAKAVLQYLETKAPLLDADPAFAGLEKLDELLALRTDRVVTQQHLQRLDEAEKAEAQRLGVEEYKLKTNEEMFQVIFGE
jgi:ferredoxin/flavodoxin---NADP+ reductase